MKIKPVDFLLSLIDTRMAIPCVARIYTEQREPNDTDRCALCSLAHVTLKLRHPS